MRATSIRAVGLSLAATILAACGAAGPSPSPSPQPEPPADAAVRLRVTAVQALPPGSTFSWLPHLVITLDGRALSPGAVPAIFPGPLVAPIVERRINPNGWARIVEAARAAGLLGGLRDFTGGQMPPGSQATRLEIAADGRLYDLVGDASRQIVCVQAPCDAPPGTPEAFAGFVSQLFDLAAVAGAENLGPERPHQPAGYAVIAAPGEPDDQGVPQPVVDWPLPGGLVAAGRPLQDGSGGRCSLIVGAAAAMVAPVLSAATQVTPWRDPADGSLHGLIVRPLLPGDGDPCEGVA